MIFLKLVSFQSGLDFIWALPNGSCIHWTLKWCMITSISTRLYYTTHICTMKIKKLLHFCSLDKPRMGYECLGKSSILIIWHIPPLIYIGGKEWLEETTGQMENKQYSECSNYHRNRHGMITSSQKFVSNSIQIKPQKSISTILQMPYLSSMITSFSTVH